MRYNAYFLVPNAYSGQERSVRFYHVTLDYIGKIVDKYGIDKLEHVEYNPISAESMDAAIASHYQGEPIDG